MPKQKATKKLNPKPLPKSEQTKSKDRTYIFALARTQGYLVKDDMCRIRIFKCQQDIKKIIMDLQYNKYDKQRILVSIYHPNETTQTNGDRTSYIDLLFTIASDKDATILNENFPCCLEEKDVTDFLLTRVYNTLFELQKQGTWENIIECKDIRSERTHKKLDSMVLVSDVNKLKDNEYVLLRRIMNVFRRMRNEEIFTYKGSSNTIESSEVKNAMTDYFQTKCNQSDRQKEP
jgi:hypothetical protein